MIPRIFILNISIFILLTSNILIANTFLPSNNSNLNYRQLEFSWPQIPNSNNYEITINDINLDLSLLIDSDDNILIYDGYDLEWGVSYTWEVCGFNNDNLPVGLQLIASPFKDFDLLSSAYMFQENTKFHKITPPICV